MEHINGEGAWYGTYHWNGKYYRPAKSPPHAGKAASGGVPPPNKCSVVHGDGGHGEVQRCVPLQRWDERFHEFAVEWDGSTRLSFYINSVLVGTVHAGQTSPTRAPEGAADGPGAMPTFFDDPMFLMLQTAVGGVWPGEPTAATALPVYHVIDYVRYEAMPVGSLLSS